MLKREKYRKCEIEKMRETERTKEARRTFEKFKDKVRKRFIVYSVTSKNPPNVLKSCFTRKIG